MKNYLFLMIFFIEKTLSKLLKYLSDFLLKQVLLFLKKSTIFDFFQNLFRLQKCIYVPVVCTTDSQFYKKLKANDLMERFTRHLEIEKTKTKPGKSLWKPKISAKIENLAKIQHFSLIFFFYKKKHRIMYTSYGDA